MKKFKKLICLMGILLMAVFLFAGCSDADTAGSVSDAGTVISEEVAESETESQNEISEESSDVTFEETTDSTDYVEYTFRNDDLLSQHYEKHGIEMGFDSKEAYQQAASDVVNNPDALHKTEAEDGDDVYYVEDTNEFVVVSGDGYLRTYFYPDAGKDYYDRQ